MIFGERIRIPRARLISADLSEAVSRGGGDAKFRATLALDPSVALERESADHMRAYIDALKPAVLPADRADDLKAALNGRPAYNCVVSGNGLTDRHGILPGCAGMICIRASSREQPALFELDGTPADPFGFQPGCYVYAIVQVYYATLGDSIPPGIYAQLLGLKFLESGGQLIRRNLRVSASDFVHQGAAI